MGVNKAMLKKFEDQSKIDEEQHRQRVFVVHGRNEELRKSMFDFLRSIGLKPIEWSQAIQMTGETAPFVGNILDEAFLHAQAVVVLLTGDDEARLRPEYHTEKMPDYERNLTPQSRPNVLFEAGLALGRFPKQTVIVEVGDLRPFSDIAGRHTIRLNNSTKTRQDVAQRLAIAGCKVDLSGTDWHQTGDFSSISFSKKINDEQAPRVSSEKPILPKKQLSFDEIRVKILIFLSTASKTKRSFGEIVNYIRLNPIRVNSIVETLVKDKLIQKVSVSSIDGMDKYALTENGKKHLLETGAV